MRTTNIIRCAKEDISRNGKLIFYFPVMIGLFLAWHGHNLFKIVSLWFINPIYYSHGAIIFLFAIYIAYKRRARLIAVTKQPALISGTLLILLAGSFYVIGKITFTEVGEHIAIILSLLGMVAIFLGKEFLKIVFLPIAYLIFLFPVAETIIGSQVFFLQNATAFIGALLLKGFGFNVYHDGLIIELPHISLEVAKACSGMNHIVGLAALSIPISTMYEMNYIGRLLMFMSAGILGLALNGLRVALIGVWVFFVPGDSVHGPGDFLLVPFVFVLGTITLVVLARISAKIACENKGKSIIQSVKRNLVETRGYQYKTHLALIISVFLVFTIKMADGYVNVKEVDLSNSTQLLPFSVDGWIANGNKIADAQIENIGSDYKVSNEYVKENEAITVFVAYLNKQSKENELFSPAINKIIRSPQIDSLNLNNMGIESTALRKYKTPNKEYHFISFFYLNGKFIGNRMHVKLETVKNVFFNKTNNGALILILSENPNIFKKPEFATFADSLTKHIAKEFKVGLR